MRGSLLASLFASAAVVGACSVYDTSLFHAPAGSAGGGGKGGASGGANDGGGGANGGGANGGAGGGIGGGGGCVLKKPPPIPAATDAGADTGGSEEAVGIMYRIDLGDAKPNISTPPTHYRDLGFDVDGICTATTNQRGQECNIPSYGFGVVDGPGGIDNALGQIIQLTRNEITGFSSDIYSAQLQQGVTNVIVHLTGYNGHPNDDLVTVETLVSAPFDSPPRKKGTLPKWDGTDEWPIASDSVIGNNVHSPLFVDKNAYVVNGKVVVTLPATAMRLVVGLTNVTKVDLNVAMRSAKIVCDLVPVTGDVRLWNWKAHNCTLSARWLANDLVHQLSHFPDPATNLPLCMDSKLYSTFRDNICGLVDVNFEASTTPNDCTAISMGLTFDTEPGLIGDVFQVSPLKDLCPVGTQPSTDNCGQVPDAGVDSGSGSGSGGTGAGGAGTGGKTGTGGAKADAGPDDASTKG